MRDARRLEREGMPWSMALACPIQAGIVAASRGDRSRAATLFSQAVTELEAVDMNLYAAAARRRLGELIGGDEGRAQVDRADSWMRQQTIQNPKPDGRCVCGRCLLREGGLQRAQRRPGHS